MSKYLFNVSCLILMMLTVNMEAAQYARRAAGMLGTAAYIGFSSAGLLIEGYFYYNRCKLEQEMEQDPEMSRDRLSRLYPMLNDFVTNELNSLGLPDVRVVPAHTSFACAKHIAMFKDDMIAANSALWYIQDAKNKGREPDLWRIAKVNRFKGVLHHEANHILHKDTTSRGFLLAVASVGLPLGAKALVKTLRVVPQYTKRIPNIRKALAGVVNGALSLELLFAGHRLVEQQADDNVHDVDAMKGMSLCLAETVAEMEEIAEEAREYYPEWQLLLMNHLMVHPSPIVRLEKVRRRLIEADEQEEKN